LDVLASRRVPWCVSGAGPSILAFEHGGSELTPEVLGTPGSWRILRPGVRAAGFELVVEDPPA
ncbi:MAG TPA: hypothetical protein VK646_12610, partial [Actinomycetota bacterium]|nr:hypothetical protein [Actinomycetota bacterium]